MIGIWQVLAATIGFTALFSMGMWVGYRHGVNETEARWSQAVARGEWARKNPSNVSPS